jgi:membrane associated rhomboid family serine protease
VFYSLCGVLAVFAQALPDANSTVPMVGASGAISGILEACLLVYPRAKGLIGIPLIVYLHTVRLPVLWVLSAGFLMQLVTPFLVEQGEGGVAFGAHVGGFIAGMLLIPFFKKPSVKLHIPFVK